MACWSRAFEWTFPCSFTSCSGGSGRSGVYRGWYLKGIGRTPLAANWHQGDYLHNTGHLAASSAIRELAISEWLRALSLDDTIVPCEGLLLAPLAPELARFAELLYGRLLDAPLPAVDRGFQAISVKRADFARASNFSSSTSSGFSAHSPGLKGILPESVTGG